MTSETIPLAPTHSISEALRGVWRDPSRFVRHWNYKGAIMSGGMRAPIFLITYLAGRESIRLALGAALVQFIFRFAFAGVGGTLIQAFRRVEPAWKALAAILLIVPVISHIFEFLVQLAFAHYTQTGDHTGDAILRSICISIVSALFTLFIMRRDVLIVGEAESKSIWNDLGRLPVLVFEFIAFIPLEIAGMLRRAEYLRAFLGVFAFGIFAQMLGWAIIGKPFWTYNKGKSHWFSFWGIDGIILLLICTALSLIFLHRRAKSSRIA
ncbi:MAG TPA: hypothetical protein VNI84_08780 [Pyrinomonadaceae bacterium]|nr:hypothetical protein [Pyrinomonadaceae bacterium]